MRMSTRHRCFRHTSTYNHFVSGGMDHLKSLPIQSAAEMLNISRSTIYRLITDGELKTYKAGRSRRIRVAVLNEFISRQENNNPPKPA